MKNSSKLHYTVYLLFIALTFNVSCKKDITIENTTEVLSPRPAGFPAMKIPADNPLTPQGIKLGKALFYEKKLSANNQMSCGTCHNIKYAFSDNGNRFSKGTNGIEGTRNTPALINLGWNTSFFWDGKHNSLEKLITDPITNPIEMNETWPNVINKLKNTSNYPQMFQDAFGTPTIDSISVSKAISQFLRMLISSNSKYDKYMRGEIKLTDSELRGLEMFNTEKADCFHCHQLDGGRLLTDNLFRNNGLQATIIDSGHYYITKKLDDVAKFRTPTLRNIALTAPYMHDGRFKTLKEVIDFYNSGVHLNNTIDPIMLKNNKMKFGLQLSEQDKQDLLNFLHTLTDESFINNPELKED